MKYYYSYIVALLSIVALCTACEKQEPDVFSATDNGVYFNYETTEDLSASCNFADYIMENPETLEVSVKVRLLGHLSDKARGVMLKGRAMEGYQEAVLEELPLLITFEPGEYEKTVVINAKRPEVDDTQYATELYLEPQDETIGTGIEGFETFSVYVGAIYEKPAEWDYSGAADYFGEWTKEKHIILARDIFEDADYLSYGMYGFSQAHGILVDYLRAQGANATFEIPYYYYANGSFSYYFKPPYWTESHDKYIANFDVDRYAAAKLFVQLAEKAGLTTRTEEAYFTGDDTKLLGIHKTAVRLMQDAYNKFFRQGMYLSGYTNNIFVYLLPDVDYDTLIQPVCWSTAYPLSNAMVEKYYGEYSDAKFKFMIETVAKQRPDMAYLTWMFPIDQEWDSNMQTYVPLLSEWLSSPDYMTSSSGEVAMYTLNQLFKAADTEGNFNFPEVAAPAGGGDDKKDDKK